MRGCFAVLALALAGCVGAYRPDLPRPLSWRETEGTVPVVADGRALTIVSDEKPANRWAAAFLARTIWETCGRRPDVIYERCGHDVGLAKGLFIGNVRANCGWGLLPETLVGGDAETTNAAFRVVAADGSVRFIGRADYAVFDWCERELGLRFYCANGKCVEKRAEIRARTVDYSDRPVFGCRSLDGNERDPWLLVAKVGNSHRGGVNAHAPHGWFRDARLKAERPEIFETGETPMLCYGNPSTLAYYKRRIDLAISGAEDSGGIVDTLRKVVTVCPWDAPIACTCPWCRTLYSYANGKAGFASPVVWGPFLQGLSSWLAESYPDYQISFLPYLNWAGVPQGLSLPDGNAEAEVCTMPGLALLKGERTRLREENLLRAWRQATGRKVLNWHYGCWPQEQTSAPYVFGQTIQRHYAAMKDVSCGTYVCGGNNDPRLALSMYVWMKCLWNPAIDVEAIYDGFARRMFGAAARPMRELIALQEAGWNEPWPDDRCSFANVDKSFPRECVRRMRELALEAYALVVKAGDETARKRVRWYVSGLDRFVAESDAIAARPARPIVRLGEVREMVVARDVWCTNIWAKTTVRTARVERNGMPRLELTVRCDEPAVAKMDFQKQVRDFVWGNDSVTFAFAEGDRPLADGDCPRAVRVLCTGEIEAKNGLPCNFQANVMHDATGWTVVASVDIKEGCIGNGLIHGNVARWRVGDRREPEASRVKGSRYEHSRLNTCFTNLDDDPAAFVSFAVSE